MTNETIKRAVLSLVKKYSITKVILFGSRASNENRPDSDVDLIVEFANPITLITLR
ncbi:MAG: nucleotidyltransferase domain-containing protein [Parasporobacterium sp.]|nr:nucleotidyltransferase domain-containing protein [Parasporobacterium sp.]